MYDKLLAAAAGALFKRLLEHPEDIQKAATHVATGLRGAVDFVRVKTGFVNLDGVREAVAKASATCLRKGDEDQARVASYVVALYLQHGRSIKRAAQVAGSLRKRFGVAWFPHIHERELRYALDVDSDLEEYVFQQMKQGHFVEGVVDAGSGKRGWLF